MIYIVGASGQAKETAAYVLDCRIDDEISFVDKEKNSDFIKVRNREFPIVFEEDFFSMSKNHIKTPKVVLAIGDPKIRAEIAEKYLPFCDFPNVIHPSVLFLADIKIGIGNIIAPMAFISIDCEIGNFNLINYGVTIGHDCKIGNFNSIYPQSVISGNIKIENNNLLGASSALIENVFIGNNNVIGMGGVCLKNIADNGKFVGVPLRNLEKQ